MSNQVTVVAFVCSLVLVATASMPPTLSELLLSTSTDQPDACCTHKCCFEFNGGCCAASCCTDCNPPATCCKGKCSAPSPPPPPGPKPPPPTPPPPTPLPCTITPTPPLGNGSRMASWWYYDTYTPSAISKMLAILKREGGNKAVTSIILDCGDLITPNGTFVRCGVLCSVVCTPALSTNCFHDFIGDAKQTRRRVSCMPCHRFLYVRSSLPFLLNSNGVPPFFFRGGNHRCVGSTLVATR